VGSLNQLVESSTALLGNACYPGVQPQWYAIHTRSQHEKSAISHLKGRGITTFLPLISEVHRWRDRRKVVQLPLFSCYAFVHIPFIPELWYKVTQTGGVLGFVGVGREGVPIPEQQIANIRQVLAGTASYSLCPFLNVGQRVRIRGGALEGIEGVLVERKGDRTLIISVEPIQRSVCVRIDEYKVEPL
jgi:transcription antitermination factor NusG